MNEERLRILIFSDSLAAPRNKPNQQLRYEETWPYLLRRAKPGAEIAQITIGSATTEEILYQTQYWIGFEPDLVICQVGVCDCLPRAMHLWETELAKRLPWADGIHKWVQQRSESLRRLRAPLVRSSEPVFLDRARLLKSLFPVVYWIGIVVDEYRPPHRFPDCIKLIRRYNGILSSVYGKHFLDLSGIEESGYMNDGFHLNSSGQSYVWKRIRKQVLEKEGY